MPVFDPGDEINPTVYVSVEEMKFALGHIADSLDDDDLLRAALAASRAIDTYCDRFFYRTVEAIPQTVLVDSYYAVVIPDVATTAGLIVQTDGDGDGVYETTWSASDYQLEPLNAQALPVKYPFTEIRTLGRLYPSNWRGRPELRITAVWGWPAVPAEVSQAALTLAVRLFRRKDAPFGVLGSADLGFARISSMLRDPDVTSLIGEFRKFSF